MVRLEPYDQYKRGDNLPQKLTTHIAVYSSDEKIEIHSELPYYLAIKSLLNNYIKHITTKYTKK